MTKRLLFFAYGVACYLVFLATFCYAIAFVGGFVVPSRLDGPLQGSLAASLFVNCALLTLFAVQHSVMARRWFKERWTQVIPWTIERSTYVLCASLALLLLFWQWRPIGIEIWSIENGAARLVIWALFGSGWAMVLVVTFLINHWDLFGLRQVWLPLVGRPYVRVPFRTPLPYRFVRHPLYFGFLLAFWMTPTMTLAHLVFALATTAYIAVAIQFEERDLGREHGAAYQDYRRRIPMLLPTFRTSPKVAGAASEPGAARTPSGRDTTSHHSLGRNQEDKAMRTRKFARRAGLCAIGVVALVSGAALEASGGADPDIGLVKVVREATERFHDVSAAEAEGYRLMFGCVTGPDAGAMGLHYVNMDHVADGALDPTRPEIVIYEPLPNGQLRLIGADFLVLTDAWHANNPAPPELMGQLLHLFESPNRFGLPAFYTLHVWAWKENPSGAFVNWHPKVSCDAFTPR